MQTEITEDFKDEKNEIRELEQRRFRALQKLWLNNGLDHVRRTNHVLRTEERRACEGMPGSG